MAIDHWEKGNPSSVCVCVFGQVITGERVRVCMFEMAVAAAAAGVGGLVHKTCFPQSPQYVRILNWGAHA